jgi:Arc/MetJ-type ribon-helix-helix transcriptional regulator
MVEKVLNTLVKQGYYKTKTEAVRAGILWMGRDYNLIPDPERTLVSKRIKQMEAEVAAGKKRMIPIEQVARKAGVKI